MQEQCELTVIQVTRGLEAKWEFRYQFDSPRRTNKAICKSQEPRETILLQSKPTRDNDLTKAVETATCSCSIFGGNTLGQLKRG